jgi:hypothetical protein
MQIYVLVECGDSYQTYKSISILNSKLNAYTQRDSKNIYNTY